MGSCAPHKAIGTLSVLKDRIGPVFTAADAEKWWPLALMIDASIMMPDEATQVGKKASHDLLWAISDVIRTLKRSGQPDVQKVSLAVTKLERELSPD